MSELQSTIEFSVELYKFYNVDLFQRGMYQVRCSLRVSSKLSVEVEVTTPEVSTGLGTAIVLGNYGACRPFQILYRNEEVSLKDVVLFRCHMLVDGNNLKESLEKAEFSLILELWFSDSSPVSMVMVSSRTLQLNMSPAEGLHYHLPVLFDYFHLSAISLTIHAVLTALHQPSMKRGLLRYMQSCAPKSSKSWSKIRSAHCSSLTDPVLPVSSHKVYSRINESPQIHLEARDVLLDASNNLKTTIKEYKILFMQREEALSENYDTLVLKPHRYDSKKSLKKQIPLITSSHHSNSFGLAELCADNIRLWNYFLLNFSCKTTIQQHLSKKHHNLRVRRFAEFFFLVYNPRRSAIGCFDANYQNYLIVAEIAKRSKYMQMLPQLPVHCAALDGDNTTMPIIFEDQYQAPIEFANENGERTMENEQDSTTFKRSKTSNDTQCSCGVDDIWEMRKCSEKTLVNMDIYPYNDPVLNPVPARHSKSLDQLQMCSRNSLHYSLSNILGPSDCHSNKGHLDKSHFYRKESKLKNVASEHNMRTQRMYIFDEDYKYPIRVEYPFQQDAICDCASNKYYTDVVRKPKKSQNQRVDLFKMMETSMNFKQRNEADLLDRKYKQFNIQNVTNVKQQNQKIVKSLSHTAADGTQNIFRSTSMQFFSPKKMVTNGVNKFNSLATKRSSNQHRKSEKTENGCFEMNGTAKSSSSESTKMQYKPARNNQKEKSNNFYGMTALKSKSIVENGTNGTTNNTTTKRFFEIGSTSSSTESISIRIKKTGSTASEALFSNSSMANGIRKVRSTSCLEEEVVPLLLSGTESLPNITPKVERLQFPEMRYCSSGSTSSTTSEQSGWITSRSSSIASSTDVAINNPAANVLFTNIESIQRNIINIASNTGHATKRNKKDKRGKSRHRTSKFLLESENGFNEHSVRRLPKEDNDFSSNKGCEYNQSNNLCDDDDDEAESDIALLPPKQFRDLEDSPSSSITNGGTNDDEINAVDNLLYHVVDTQTTLDRKPTSQLNEDVLKEGVDGYHHHKSSKSESEKAFARARSEFKSQLNFPGILYSDFTTTFASTVPYFHISDEFRIFSPEGMHLIVCVHGLDGNSADLRLVKTYLELGLPGAYLDFLMSERNQGDTFSDFETMTDRLVSEILHYLDMSSIRPTRMSFVGHSLGNVIIRSALTRPQMKFLLPRLHTFLSLSGPHLGTLYNSSGLVNMGMWFMQKWKKSGSLLQLCLKDSTDARQSFLYRLSQRSTLHHFKNVLLCGSGQDRYVPLHSARIELCKESIKDTSDQGAIYREMVHNIISPILAQKEVNLVRYDVHHALPNTANALIGRAAHIAVLDSELFIEKFMAVVGIKYFR